MRILFQLAVSAADGPAVPTVTPAILWCLCQKEEPVQNGGFLRLRRYHVLRMRRFHSLSGSRPSLAAASLQAPGAGSVSAAHHSILSIGQKVDHGLGLSPIGRHGKSPASGPIIWQRVRLWTPGEPVLGSVARDSSLSVMASEKPQDLMVTCTAPVNIAVIKYCECWRQGHLGRDRGIELEAVVTGTRGLEGWVPE